jgi:hypothetical protein
MSFSFETRWHTRYLYTVTVPVYNEKLAQEIKKYPLSGTTKRKYLDHPDEMLSSQTKSDLMK